MAEEDADPPEEGKAALMDPLTPYVAALQRWKLWRNNVPAFYRTCVNYAEQTPVLSVQLFPRTYCPPANAAFGLLGHYMLYGSCAPEGEPGDLAFANVLVQDPSAGQLTDVSGANTYTFNQIASYSHDGDVDRLRYCPDRPALVAVKCTGASLSLYDISAALSKVDELERKGDEEAARSAAAESRAADSKAAGGGRSTGQAAEGDAMSTEGEDAGSSDGEDAEDVEADEEDEDDGVMFNLGGAVSTLRSPEQDGVSLAWGTSSSGGGGGGGSGGGAGGLRLFSGVRLGGVGEYAVREDGSLASVCVRRGGHDPESDVADLAWGGGGGGGAAEAAGPGPSSSRGVGPGVPLLASVGTDGRTLLWDTRQARHVMSAPRCRQDVNGVAWSSAAGRGGSGSGEGGGAAPLLANGGKDGVVRVYDVRQLSNSPGGGGSGGAATAAAAAGSSAAGSATAAAGCLHQLRAHRCEVLQLAFSPHTPSLLASSDKQGRVLMWDLGRKQALPEGLPSRPQLVFAHAGHVLPVDDFGWSTELYGTLASVAGFLHVDLVDQIRALPGLTELENPPAAVMVWRPAADLLPPPPTTSPARAARAGAWERQGPEIGGGGAADHGVQGGSRAGEREPQGLVGRMGCCM